MSRRAPAPAGAVDAVLLPSLGNLSLNKREEDPWPEAEDIEGKLTVDLGGDLGEQPLVKDGEFDYGLLNLKEKAENAGSKWVAYYTPTDVNIDIPPDAADFPSTWTSFYPGGDKTGLYNKKPHFNIPSQLQLRPKDLDEAHKPLLEWAQAVDKPKPVPRKTPNKDRDAVAAKNASEFVSRYPTLLDAYKNGNKEAFRNTLSQIDGRGHGASLESPPLPDFFWVFTKKNVPDSERARKGSLSATYKPMQRYYVGPIYAKWNEEGKEGDRGWRMTWEDTPKKAWLTYLGYQTSGSASDSGKVAQNKSAGQEAQDRARAQNEANKKARSEGTEKRIERTKTKAQKEYEELKQREKEAERMDTEPSPAPNQDTPSSSTNPPEEDPPDDDPELAEMMRMIEEAKK